ncbi:MAG TPA: polysaccharide deacetylase family protein [Paludibacter sp.]|nr:MAG: Peptidoglycan-N-acetylglucosamine deacetylase [Bacteroidetes bacterium ADurb.Bin174]HQB28074.1 polysaccharide deacetylase family protein [Paludibacter sp.]
MQLSRLPSLFFPSLTWRVKTHSKLIYLTFDDGPVPQVTPQVLDILDTFGWKATFFCVGENVAKHPDLYREVLARGHRTGNHSYNHIRGFRYTTDEYVQNVKKASEMIQSKLFRPPHGRMTFAQMKALRKEYDIVMWDVITYDYDQKRSPERILKTIKRNLRKGSVVVFHDSLKAKENVLEVLPKALEFWESEGYDCGLL